MEEDDVEYLQPDFDPSSLTVARLRGLLVQHNIPYPASAKKGQLVETFRQELAPQARKILAARSRIQRTSRGITDMPSSQETSTSGDVDELPPTTRRQRSESPRKRAPRGTRQSTTETLEEQPVPRKTSGRKPRQPRISDDDVPIEPVEELPVPKKTPGRKPRQPRISDDSVSAEPAEPHRARLSDLAPAFKVEASGPSKRTSNADSVFSDDNPFQSGSSPAAGEERRRSSGVHDKRRSTSNRRKSSRTPAIKEEDSAISLSRTIEFPVSRLANNRVKRESTPALEPGEEFTPEEEQALIQEGAMRGEVDVLTPRRRPTARSSAFGTILWPVLLSVLIGYAFLYRKEKIELGYCGVGKSVTALEEYDAPEWLSFLQPQCEPCPPHASCFAGMRVRCDQDFMLQPHPLSLGGAVPIPPSCEPDGEKVRKVHAVADKAVEELRERRAKFECGELTEDTGKIATAVEIEEPQLKAQVSQKRRRGMSEAEFEELWKGAIGEVLSREEVTSTSSRNSELVLSSSSLARLPISCAVRRSARLTMARYRVEVGGVMAVLALVLFVRNYIRTLRSDAARVPALVSTTLDRLATEAALHSQGARPEPWISVGQMRDDVLRDEFSAKRREDIWRRVQRVVEVNANVRSSVREDRNGEVSRVWEWIGSLPTMDDQWLADRRKSGRLSWAPSELRDTPERRGGSPAAAGEGGTTTDTRRWDEGRPIY